MDDPIDAMLIEVRASTEMFSQDIAQMRNSFDITIVDSFAKAGNVLETGLLQAVRKGSLSFEDLQRTASRALDQIAAQALQLGLDRLFGSSDGRAGGFGSLFNGLLGGLLGLPGRATGGPVAPGRGYIVGERGPEVFVPTSAGRVETPNLAPARTVNVALRVTAPHGSDTPRAMQRSGRQVASAIRRALSA